MNKQTKNLALQWFAENKCDAFEMVGKLFVSVDEIDVQIANAEIKQRAKLQALGAELQALQAELQASK